MVSFLEYTTLTFFLTLGVHSTFYLSLEYLYKKFFFATYFRVFVIT